MQKLSWQEMSGLHFRHKDLQKTWAVMEDVRDPGKVAGLDAQCTIPCAWLALCFHAVQ